MRQLTHGNQDFSEFAWSPDGRSLAATIHRHAAVDLILVDADTEQFLGATILGVGGDEVINMFTAFMYTKQSYQLFRKAVLTHPTVAELMPWILDDLRPLT
jgi:pyruvate/2-oxoglutarate dehydrogenase complex dihydrolipoamide dehydrogenase (E3) component